MTYTIAQPCVDVKNQSCVDVCPVDQPPKGHSRSDRLADIEMGIEIDTPNGRPNVPVQGADRRE